MILHNLHIVPGGSEPANIRVCNGKITGITPADTMGKAGHLNLCFRNALAFPGLINSHDHLDFNLFPQLGGQVYNNYTQWGRHIHTAFKDKIAAILKIPAHLRYEWGVYKNLLCGVTTVVNHGERTGLKTDLLTINEDSQSLHSVSFEKNWKLKLNNPLKKKQTVNIHIGEGTDAKSVAEINALISFNLLKRKLVGVHGVSMTKEQARAFDALVWCPESNFFLLDKTAQVNLFQTQTALLFGTDSTLTGNWNIWHHLQSARSTGLLNDETLFDAVTLMAAAVWGLNSGSIIAGKDADLVIADGKVDGYGFDAFFSISPKDILLVTHRGSISLYDESLLPQLQDADIGSFSRIFFGDRCKYVKGDLPGLIRNIRRYNPDINFPVTINEAAGV